MAFHSRHLHTVALQSLLSVVSKSVDGGVLVVVDGIDKLRTEEVTVDAHHNSRCTP